MKRWYLLNYQNRHYSQVFSQLSASGINYYTPYLIRLVLRSDKKNVTWRRKQSPLFPGYMFIHFDVEKIHTTTLKKMSGVIDFVRKGKEIVIVPEKIIGAIGQMPKAVIRQNKTEIECGYIDPVILLKIERMVSFVDPNFRFSSLINMLNEFELRRVC